MWAQEQCMWACWLAYDDEAGTPQVSTRLAAAQKGRGALWVP
jgi:hypothetical protein